MRALSPKFKILNKKDLDIMAVLIIRMQNFPDWKLAECGPHIQTYST